MEDVPRRPREDVAGAVQHAYARGVDRQIIFRDDHDRRRYLATLADVIDETGWLCLTYCLMDNHVHLIVETPHANLGSGIQLLHGRYGLEFNERHDRIGHLFQGRFGAVRMRSEVQLWAAIRYVVLNPVNAGLCTRPDDWRWSSHAAVVGDGLAPRWLAVERLLSYFSGLGGDPLRIYRTFTGAGLTPEGSDPSGVARYGGGLTPEGTPGTGGV